MATLSAAAYSRPLSAIVTAAHKPRDILELELKKGQRLLLLEPKGEWWYIARFSKNGKEGWVPAKHIRILTQLDKYTLGKLFLDWYEKREAAFGDGTSKTMETGVSKLSAKLDRETFPFPPAEIDVCDKVTCKLRKRENGLGACVHDMEVFLKSGFGEVYGAKCLWVESLNWHPDRVGRKCRGDWMGEGKKAAAEMYVILGELIEKARKKGDGQ